MANTEDLITLLAVAGRPVRVDEAAAALKIDAEDVLAVVEELVDAGQVLDTADGVATSESTPEPKSASRTSYLAGKWAEALDSLGGDATEIGLAYLKAGQHQKAAEKLVPVALGEGTSAAVNGALAAGQHGNFYSKVTEGQLHLSRAAHRSASGDTRGASDDLDIAIRHLEGVPLVDALGFASSVASNLQHPQKSETLAALGAWHASHVGEPAKQGSLLTLQARELSRVGFPVEADRANEVGRQLVDTHGTSDQRENAHWNAAWVMFDRGEARKAEAEFANLRDRAKEGDPVSLGSREAYWARALFGNGQAKAAIEAADRAEAISEQTGADAPAFIAGLARMEGALNFARYEDAASHAEAVLEVIRRALPQWENVGLVGLARAYAGMGEVEKAHETLDAALEATPAGIDGWRLRLHIQEIRISLTPDSDPWPQKDAEDLTDALLQARWFDSAAHLMCIRSHRENDRDLGVEAAALAIQIGNPMLASRATESAEVWDEPIAVPVARAVRQVEQHVPEEWIEEWRALDSIVHAYQVDTEVDVDSDELTSHIDDALEAAGLAGTDVILSPAQRQAKGLVRRRPRRRTSVGALVGVGVGAVVLSVGIMLGLGLLDPPTTTTPVADPTTTTTLIEQNVVALPERGVFGTVEYRGGAPRTGVMEDGGFSNVLGHYFEIVPGGNFKMDAMAYGRYLIVAGDTPGSELVLVNMGSDAANMGTWINVGTAAELSAPPAVKTVQQEGAAAVPLMIVTTEDGRVHGRNALIGTSIWRKDAGGVVVGTPLFVERPDGVQILVGTDAGVVISFDIDGNENWRYEGSDQNPLAGIDRPMAYHDGFVYLVDSEGVLHVLELAEPEPEDNGGGGGLIDPSGGEFGSSEEDEVEGEEPAEAAPFEFVCDHQYGQLAIGTAPIISGGIVYVPTATGSIFMSQAGSCFRQPSDRTVPQIETFTQFGMQFAPIIQNNVIYMVDNTRILAIGAKGEGQLWVFNSESPITGAPIMAGGIIYFGTQRGEVFALDPETQEAAWTFDIGESIFGSVVPVKGGAVFALTAEGTVVAIAVE